MSVPSHLNGMDLSQPRVAAHTVLVVMSGGVDIAEGGLIAPMATSHVRVVNGDQGTAWLIPVSKPFLTNLRDQIDKELTRIDGATGGTESNE